MISYQRGTTLLVPVCLLLTLVTTAVWTFSKQVRHYAVSQQRTTERNSLLYRASEALLLTHHALTTTSNWQTTLTSKERGHIREYQHLNIRGASMTFFRLSASASNSKETMTVSETLGIVRLPVMVVRPTLALTFSEKVSPDARITLVDPDNTSPVYHARVPLAPALSLQQYCKSNSMRDCQPLSPADAVFPKDIVAHTFEIEDGNFSPDSLPDRTALSGCTNVASTSSHVIWVTGDCHIPSKVTLGTLSQPVLLIIEDGHLSVGSGAVINGLLITLARKSRLPKDIIVHSSGMIAGAAIIAQPLSASSVIRLTYSSEVINKLQNAHYMQRATFLPGSWHDF